MAVVIKEIAKSDVDGYTTGYSISDVMFQYTGGDYQIGFWMNGTSTWQGTGVGKPKDWVLLGSYDMDCSRKADQVMFGKVEGGAYIGYYKDGNTTDDGWVTIGFLSNSSGITWQNKVGNLTGNAGKNSIVWFAPELKALGVWKDGKEDWVSLAWGIDGNWNLVGCGDFDAGKDKDSAVLMDNYGNVKISSIDDANATDLCCVGSGWTLSTIGDFSKDGIDDLVFFSETTGSIFMMKNGTEYQNVGQLDANDWFICGAGDYNGDGKDDLLVRQYSTGMLGYYDSCDMSKWNELGRGVDTNWSVIA